MSGSLSVLSKQHPLILLAKIQSKLTIKTPHSRSHSLLSGFVVSAAVDEPETCEYVCNSCKGLVAGLKEHPEYLDLLLQLCQFDKARVDKCEKDIKEVESIVSSKTPEQVCQQLHLCKPSKFVEWTGFFWASRDQVPDLQLKWNNQYYNNKNINHRRANWYI